MTFVYPLLLGGLLLAGLPVLLHFLVRKKPKTLTFPAFQFLLQKQHQSRRNLRLKHLLLLAMRIALLALLCLALARPRLFHESLGLSRERPVAMVLVFDTTPSMGYKVNDQTRLDFAKKRALELLEQLPEEGRFLVLDVADPDGFAREDWSKSVEKARQRIQRLALRPQSVPITRAIQESLRRCDSLEEGERMPRFVCVFSDRTKMSWESTLSPRTHDATTVLYFDVGIDAPIDLGIVHADFIRGQQPFAQGDRIELNALVKATGERMTNTLLCRIGERELAQPFEMDKNAHRTLSFLISSEKLAPGFHQAELRFETNIDALVFNNTRFVTFEVQKKPRVLVLADDVSKVEDFVLALEVLNHDVATKTPADKAALHEYAAVFVIDVAAPTDALWQALGAYAQDRGVCVIPAGNRLQPSAYNTAAARSFLPARFVEPVSASPGSEWNLDANPLQHAFLRPLLAWAEIPNLDFRRYPRRATRSWRVVPQEKSRDIATVVEYDDGRPAILEREFPKGGKVLLLTTPMDDRTPVWNNYGERIAPFTVTLTSLCARHLIAATHGNKTNFIFGQAPPSVKQDFALPRATLQGPGLSEELRFDKERWVGDRLPKAGHYTILGANPDAQRTEVLTKFSINEPGEESDLTRLARAEIEAVLGPDRVIAQDRRIPLLDSILGHWDEPVELFPWLMIAVLFLLALENLLANRFYRKEEPADA